jgi:hypothetical protein
LKVNAPILQAWSDFKFIYLHFNRLKRNFFLKKMMRNLNKISVLFMIIVTALLRLVEAQDYKYYDISENDRFYNQVIMLQTGDILVRFFTPINASCYEPDLHLKLLHENGTSSPFEIENFSPSSFNFCLRFPYVDSISLLSVRDYIYILYYNRSESDPTAPFSQFILQANLEGKIIK